MPNIDRDDEHATRYEMTDTKPTGNLLLDAHREIAADQKAMTDTKPTLDEQIEAVRQESSFLAGYDSLEMHYAVLASLERLKQITESAEMPVEPDVVKDLRAGMSMHYNPNFSSRDGHTLVEYIDTLKAVIQRKEAEANMLKADNGKWEKEAIFQRDKCWTYIERAESAERERDALIAENEGLRKGLNAVAALINESYGVSGLHLNGDIASWAELRTGGRFEDWLVDFDAAIDNAMDEGSGK
jgi:hypothetical protein